MNYKSEDLTGLEIAIIGIGIRFPGAETLEAFWKNLSTGTESISHFSEQQLIEAGVSKQLLEAENFVRAKGIIDEGMAFENGLFNFSSREALTMDPQLRIYHETVFQALVDAGYDSEKYKGLIGIYGGAGSNPFWTTQFLLNEQQNMSAQYEAGNLIGQEFFNTRVANKLNLKGPAVTIQTACSSSLVAVHMAVNGLIAGDCDIALAGGVEMSTDSTQKISDVNGYMYQEGMIYARDAHCRPFDKNASGTVPGDGAGVVVLKRLEEAVADGDNIYAVIKGTAINNDGNDKAGFTAPSASGQVAAIASALEMAEVDSNSISYVEAHGTGTSLGDPIEVRALTQAYQESTESDILPNGYCRIGSVKSNFGHLGAAAGVAGLIKTTLALKNKKIPPSLNYQQANSEIDFESSPFKVATQLEDWDLNDHDRLVARRAGVSSFGIGGTNAHVIVEEFNTASNESNMDEESSTIVEDSKIHSMLISATNEDSIVSQGKNLADFIEKNSELSLTTIASNLQFGRKQLDNRMAVYGKTRASIIEGLRNIEAENRLIGKVSNRKVVFMFPGQGAQYNSMGLELYNHSDVFRQSVDQCFDILRNETSPENELYSNIFFEQTEDKLLIDKTQYTQPLLFILEYALAKYLESIGVKPDVMIGHSLGEYVAATIAGVFDLQTALTLVCKRGSLMATTRKGAMLAVAKSRAELELLLPEKLAIAAENTPNSCVVSGEAELINQFAAKLSESNINNRLLRTLHGYHSCLMEPVLSEYCSLLQQLKLAEPKIPFVSNLTGEYITRDQATSADYWTQHLRQEVKFSTGINTLLSNDSRNLFIEIGPGKTLSAFVRNHKQSIPNSKVVNLLPSQQEDVTDYELVTKAILQMYLTGIDLDWEQISGVGLTKRVSLPGYVFNRTAFYPKGTTSRMSATSESASTSENDTNLLKKFVPSWYQAGPLSLTTDSQELFTNSLQTSASCWLVFDEEKNTSPMCEFLRKNNQRVVVVNKGEKYERLDANNYLVNPTIENDFVVLFEELLRLQAMPDFVLHCWTVSSSTNALDELLDHSFYSLVSLVKALGTLGIKKNLRLSVVSSQVQSVTGDEVISPAKSTLLGALRVIGQEYKEISTQNIDLINYDKNNIERKHWMQLITDILSEEFCQFIAYRGNYRWYKRYNLIELKDSKSDDISTQKSDQIKLHHFLKSDAHYLITGGLGGMGLTLAESIAEHSNAKITLVSRKILPEKSKWDELLSTSSDKSLVTVINKLKSIEAKGSQVAILSADVSDQVQMEKVALAAEEIHGSVNGIIHAAGVAGGGAIQLKNRGDIERVFRSKIYGTNVLANVFDQRLDFVCLASSVTALFGGFGQVDYCAANAYLDAIAVSKQFNSERTFSINWDPWKEVGMAVNAIEKGDYAISNHELLGSLVSKNNEGGTFKARLSGKDDWILSEHKLMSEPTAPGSAYLEMARAAFYELTDNSQVVIEDAYFLMPLTLTIDQWAEVTTRLTKENDYYYFSVSSRLLGTGKTREHARGKLSYSKHAHSKSIDISALIKRCSRQSIDNPKDKLNQLKDNAGSLESYEAIETGPHWDVFEQLYIGDNEAVARLALDSLLAGELDNLLLHPAIIDCATAFFSAFVDNSLYLPLFYKRVEQFKPLTSQVISHVSLISDSNSDLDKAKQHSTLRFDINIYSVEGELLVAIYGFEMKQVVANTSPQPIEQQADVSGDSLVNDNQQNQGKAQDLLENAITNREGKAAFESILSSPYQNVVVTRSNLNVSLQEGRNSALLDTKDEQETLQPRPDLANAYVVAKTQTEKALSQIWSSILSIEKVGVNDDFFELGGDSLMLMQVHSSMNEKLDTNVAIAELYNYQTIRTLASYIDGDVERNQQKQNEKLDQRVEQMKAAKKKRRNRSRTV